MKHSPLWFASVLFALVAQSFANDDFDSNTNPSGWSFGVTSPDVIEASGGNPGGWLHNSQIDVFAPILANDVNIDSVFNGNFRAMGVTGIRIDARTDNATFGTAGRDFSLVLRDTKGTATYDDDDYAFFVGPLIPQAGQGWVNYQFTIPSQSTDAVPSGWSGGYSGDLANFRPGIDWNDVIQNVDRVEFWWINPTYFALFQQWDAGADNIELLTSGTSYVPFCDPADNNSTGLPTILTGNFLSGVGSGLHLEAEQGPPTQFGYFLVGSAVLDPGLALSQGHLCLDPNSGSLLGRYNLAGTPMNSIGQFDGNGRLQNVVGTATSTGGSGFDVPLDLPTIGGTIAAGSTWHFQLWYREAGGASNFSNGQSATF